MKASERGSSTVVTVLLRHNVHLDAQNAVSTVAIAMVVWLVFLSREETKQVDYGAHTVSFGRREIQR